MIRKIGQIRKSVVGDLGPSAVHALEDGVVVGLVIGFTFTYLPLAVILLAAVTGLPKRAGPLAIVSEVSSIVREDDARKQESYFAGALVVGVLLGLSVGSLVSIVAVQSGVSLPVDQIV